MSGNTNAGESAQARRDKRLADALRANLRRRKARQKPQPDAPDDAIEKPEIGPP